MSSFAGAFAADALFSATPEARADVRADVKKERREALGIVNLLYRFSAL
jgi:hypothetical protein